MILFIMSFFNGINFCYSQTQHGLATYYGKSCTGLTASGERMNPNSLTCAHKTYPFGTILKVTSKKTGESVNVRVIDRGPFGKNRIVDLSYGAAKTLGMIKAGVIDVVIEVVELGESVTKHVSHKHSKHGKHKKHKRHRH